MINNESNYVQIQIIHRQSFNYNMNIETNLDNIHVCGEEQQIGSCSHPKVVEMLPIIKKGSNLWFSGLIDSPFVFRWNFK